MELGPLGTQELVLIAGGILLIILLVVLVVALRGRADDEEPREGDASQDGERTPRRSPSITQSSRDELIERAIRAETERDIFRATVKRLRTENERLRGGRPREDDAEGSDQGTTDGSDLG